MKANISFPAEWHPQSGIQITWPHPNTDWNEILEEVTNCYIQFSREILKRQKLLIVCPDPLAVRAHFTPDEQQNLITATANTNDTWARDHAGISVLRNGKPAMIDFGFNGWGLKFAANHDNQITSRLFAEGVYNSSVEYISHLNFILEGGAIESDGKGTLMTTSQCMLAPNRNQPMQQHEIEAFLKENLGVQRVLWVSHGYLAGDDTDSHIDTLARFCNETTIAYVQCTDPADEHYEELQKMEEELKQFRTTAGTPYQLIPLPMAQAVYDDEQRLPATYANFLILNDAVLMPTYASPLDEVAIQQMQKAFPHMEIVGIDCRALIKQHGSLHCVTMQLPEGYL